MITLIVPIGAPLHLVLAPFLDELPIDVSQATDQDGVPDGAVRYELVHPVVAQAALDARFALHPDTGMPLWQHEHQAELLQLQAGELLSGTQQVGMATMERYILTTLALGLNDHPGESVAMFKVLHPAMTALQLGALHIAVLLLDEVLDIPAAQRPGGRFTSDAVLGPVREALAAPLDRPPIPPRGEAT